MSITTVSPGRFGAGRGRLRGPLFPRSRGRRARKGGLGIALAACTVLAVVGALTDVALRAADAENAGPPPSAPAAKPARPPWTEVNQPIHLFELSGSDFGRQPLVYRARRRDGSDERQDVLTYGTFGTGTPFLTLSLLRRDANPPPRIDFLVGMIRLAGEARLALTANGLPALLPTRFGAFATADVTLSTATASGPCLGFRLETPPGPAPVDIAGLACRPGGGVLDRATLACVLERIDLLSAGDDAELRSFFVDAERRRSASCGPAPLLAAGTRPLFWLDTRGATPAMRHLIGSRVR